ncbi:MAG: XdhC family protein [Acidimicrobiales bacterium]
MNTRISELLDSRVPFVRAIVVRTQPPASARTGDEAVILADGTIEGFVGGQCAGESVRTAALGVLEDRASLLLRILPDGGPAFPASPGARVVVNPCLSGGAIEIFLEPLSPDPLIGVVGVTPVADAIASLAGSVGFSLQAVRAPASAPLDGMTAVIVASHGRDEEVSIQRALDAGIGFIGLVASSTRGEAVLSAMGLTKEERERIHTPVGLDIGAESPGEIALSIVAAVVRAVRIEGLVASPSAQGNQASRPSVAVDPVCGMTVVVGPETAHRMDGGVVQWFCSLACRDQDR